MIINVNTQIFGMQFLVERPQHEDKQINQKRQLREKIPLALKQSKQRTFDSLPETIRKDPDKLPVYPLKQIRIANRYANKRE
jgi:hypothetical protein